MLVFLYLLNVVLITRALWVFQDKQVRLPVLVAGVSIQLSALLLLRWGPVVLYLIAGIVIVNLLTWLLERRGEDQGTRLGARLFGLACWLMVLGCLCSDLFGGSFGGWAISIVHCTQALSDALSLVGPDHLLAVSVRCAGVFLAVVEAHTAVRFLFQALDVKPIEQRDVGSEEAITVDQVEYNRGRVIGALERLVTFFLVLKGEYGGLGFLIATKGIARFKQLDDREFAEYFLIGTFLSIIFAGAVALLAQSLLEAWR
jgi:hypothetical protein